MSKNIHNPRVPVVAPDGEPLMPTKASRARRWIKEGKAKPRRTKTGVFYVQLLVKPSGRRKQDIALSIDPGSKYDGYSVGGPKDIVITGMLELPSKVSKKIERRRQQRRNRRYRKTRRRKPKFDNRKREDNWIAPSQKAKVDARITIIDNLKRIIPISIVIIEDVRFNHYRHRHGKYFSTVEIGKTKLYEYFRNNFDIIIKTNGRRTYYLRNKHQLHKTSNKREYSVFSHVTDTLAHIFELFSISKPQHFLFYIWKRLEIPKRQLHMFQYQKGGIRRKYGGSKALGFIKGTIVKFIGNSQKYLNKLFRTGGSSKNRISLHTHDIVYKRVTQMCKPENIVKIFYTPFLWQTKFAYI